MDAVKVIQDLSADFVQFKDAHNAELTELKKAGFVSAETKTKLETIESNMDKLEAKFNEIKKVDTANEQ